MQTYFNTGASSVIEEPSILSGDELEVPRYGTKYDHEAEAEAVRRMKAGDLDARDQFIECLQPFLGRLARKYAATYSWAASFIDYENIFSELNYRLMVLLTEKNVATIENPSGYVRTALSRSIAGYCFKFALPITMPQESDLRRSVSGLVSVVSLDAPLGADTDTTLADVLIAPECLTTKTAMTSEDDYRDLYAAMEHNLTSRQRDLVNGKYGLNQTPETPGVDMDDGIYTKLRKVLTPPEEIYARELAAWNAGNQTPGKFSAALGIGTDAGARRLELMRRAGLIQTRARAIDFARQKDAAQRGTTRRVQSIYQGEPLPPIPPEVTYARELEVWNAGNQGVTKFSKAMNLSKNAATYRMEKMRQAGLIQCHAYAPRYQRKTQQVQA